MKKFLKLVIAIFALPLLWGFTRAFFHEMSRVHAFTVNTYFLFGGVLVYCVIHYLSHKPMFLYTFGHEAVHAIAAILSGGKVRSFHASENGGSVATTKTSTLIELAPYVVPFYTLLLLFFIPVVKSKLGALVLSWYIGLVGFALGMHIMMTLETMKVRQPDIVKSGYLFSVVLIYLVNIAVVVALTGLFSSGIGFLSYLKYSIIISKNVYIGLWQAFVGI